MNKTLLLIIAALVVIGGGLVYSRTQVGNQPLETIVEERELPVGGSPGTETEVETFNVSGTSFDFDPEVITVNKGDTVRITFKNNEEANPDRPHDFVISGYDLKTKQLLKDEEDTIEFVADKAGTFEFYCSVGNGFHKNQGMVGKLIVNE